MSNGNRTALLASIAGTIADYRQGKIPTPDPTHVDRWISQFPRPVQDPLLAELDLVLKRTYFNRGVVDRFLGGLIRNPLLVGADAATFWRGTNFLNIQQKGNSQKEMLAQFNVLLRAQLGLAVASCGSQGGSYVYIDDVIFSGLRVRHDLEAWIASPMAPQNCNVEVVVIGYHSGGKFHAETKAKAAAAAAGKSITFRWWHCLEVEDRKARMSQTEVLRPTRIPNDPLAVSYAAMLTQAGFPPELRVVIPGSTNRIFSSEPGRELLEQELLTSGLRIRQLCRNLPESCRPLGFSGLRIFGSGALIVTHRNCPNNCPLAFWVDHPWYPLFPRKTN